MASPEIVRVKNRPFRPLFSPQAIAARVAELGAQISADYAGREIMVIPILNGSFIFAADLVRQITVPCQVNFIKVGSYKGMESRGQVEEVLGLVHSLKDCHVLLVEDIVDTGLTMSEVCRILREQSPASIQVAALLSKPESIQKPVPLAYTGFEIAPDFVIGYGLDYDGMGRELPGIYVLAE